jgi:phosphate-selective porin OprO and OprP
MFERIWQQLGRVTLGSCAALLLVASTATADDAAKDREIQELKARQEEQAKQIESLQKMIQNQQQAIQNQRVPVSAATVEEIVAEQLKAQDAKKAEEEAKKKKEAEEKGYEVGSDLRMSASWNNGVWVESANKDFRAHVGTWVQADEWFFKQPANLRGAAPGGALGVPGTSGVGTLDDGGFLRRARLLMEGNAYETIEWKANFCFENVDSVVFDEVWVGINELPVIGTIRFGHVKNPQGLESFSSTRFIPMIERSALLDTFWDEFATGILIANQAFDKHMTWEASLTRNDIIFNQSAAAFGDGTYSAIGRVTLLPIYENDGRCLLHLGASFRYRTGDVDRDTNLAGTPVNGGLHLPFGVDTSDVIRFRARPDFRDTVTVPSGAGLASFPTGGNGRFIDTGNILSPYVMTTGGELLWYWNRLNVQAEATWAHLDHAFYPATTAGLSDGLLPAFHHVGSLDFWGAYGQVGFFLLSGKRGYDRNLGRYDRVIPDENFFLVRGEDGAAHGGTGALEALYRYTFIDLNDKIVHGGQMIEHTFGLNWYLNPNMKLQTNYVIAQRDVFTFPGQRVTSNDGTVRALGFQVAFDF